MKNAQDGGWRSWKRWAWVLGVLPLVLGSCAGPPSVPAPMVPTGTAYEGVSDMPWNGPVENPSSLARARPGLGTGWGREVASEIGYTSFERDSSKPYGGVAAIYYNDREGVEAMTGWKSAGSTMQRAAGGLVEWGVKASGRSLKNYNAGGRRFVVGKEGQRYELVVKNRAQSWLEVVLSVDGLDVMDGRTASTKKRGYLVAPGRTLEVKGWRTSESAVASFRFSGVGNSYANLKHGDARNVGVIGLAVFTPEGVDPFAWMPHEVEQRRSASPFADPPVWRAR